MIESELSYFDDGICANDLKTVTSFLFKILDEESAQNRYVGVPDIDKSALVQIDTLTDCIDNSKSKAIKQQLEKLCFSIKYIKSV